jgi:hypothetical protein
LGKPPSISISVLPKSIRIASHILVVFIKWTLSLSVVEVTVGFDSGSEAGAGAGVAVNPMKNKRIRITPDKAKILLLANTDFISSLLSSAILP